MDDDLRITIGTEARKARRRLKLTQETVAERVGISSEFYARIERGHTLPSVPTLHLITKILGISGNASLGIVREEPAETPPPPPLLLPDDPPVMHRLLMRLSGSSSAELQLITAFTKELEKRHRHKQPVTEPSTIGDHGGL